MRPSLRRARARLRRSRFRSEGEYYRCCQYSDRPNTVPLPGMQALTVGIEVPGRLSIVRILRRLRRSLLPIRRCELKLRCAVASSPHFRKELWRSELSCGRSAAVQSQTK